MACSSTGALRSLPLLVFEHQPTRNESTTATGDDDDQDNVPEMLMFSLSEARRCTEPTPAMLSPKDNQICFATPQGWIFVIHGASPWETWLWHPLTGETMPLPPIRDDHYVPNSCTCLLTHSSAAHPDCAVVLLDVGDPDMWFCRVNGGGSRAWGQHTYDVGEYTLPADSDPEDVSDGDGEYTDSDPEDVSDRDGEYRDSDPEDVSDGDGEYTLPDPEDVSDGDGEYTLPDPDPEPEDVSDGDSTCTPPTKRVISTLVAALGGKLHFIFSESNQDKMGVVELDFDAPPGPTAELHTLEDVDAAVTMPEGMCSCVSWLLESQGELFQVRVCFREFNSDDIGAVLVYKMDFGVHARCWRVVHDIGDRVFMLARGGNAVSCPAAACKLQGNRIYFMKNFLQDDGDLCIYDMAEQVMEILVVHQRDLTLARVGPYWIVPPAA